tara:strand:+ start:992 stop:5134 length:4143 start_codon:yes stop_codon:yes gene_type:complete
MAEDNQPLNSAEDNNETSWYKSFGAGLASGIIKIPEGIVSLGAELIDLGADSDTAADVEEFFDKINIFEETAEERTIGKLTQAITQIAVPGGIGFKVANKAARKLTTKALKAKRAKLYKNPKDPNFREGLKKVNELNKRAKYPRFAAAVTGGAAGETLVVDTDEIGTFGDMFDGPTSLDRDEGAGGSEDASRKLMNRFKFGSESLLITPFAFGVGASAKALAKRGKDLAYSSSKFERFIDKYIRAPFSPRGDLPEEVFRSEVIKQGLKNKDAHRAKEIIGNITRVVDRIFPVAQEAADKTIKGSKSKFMKDVNEILLEGDIGTGIDQKKLKKLIDTLEVKDISKDSQDLLVDALDAGRKEFNNLLEILQQTSKGAGKGAQTELKDLFKKRLEGFVGNTFKIFQHKSNIFNFFSKYKPTDEVKKSAINVFRAGGRRTEQESRDIVDQILKQAEGMNKPKQLPDFKYTSKSMEGGKLKTEVIGLSENAAGTRAEKKALRELFGEIKDPRFTLFNGMTNLSSLARTSAYLGELQAKNLAVQAKGGRGFFWDSKAIGELAVDAKNSGVELVPMREVLGEIDSIKNIVNPLTDTYTTREIGEGIKAANDVMSALQGFVRGQKKNMSSAEKTVSWFYRNLLLFPKGVSQMAKTIFSIPTHLRNFFSAGAFTAANGILFEGLSNPKLLKEAFQQGLDVSGLLSKGSLKIGKNSARANAAYNDMLELGLAQSQVQMGDMIALLKDAGGGERMLNLDTILGRFFNKFKKVGEFLQGKYMAEDETFKITNFVVELNRIVKANAKRAGMSVDDFKKGLKQEIGKDGVPIRNNNLWKLKKEAAEIVQNTVPNYAFVGQAVKTARLLPIGNFMSFPSEIIRTSTNIARQGIKEMTHSRPTVGTNIGYLVFDKQLGRLVKNDALANGTWGTGFKRMTGMAATLTGIPIAVTEGAKALYDVTEEEIDAMRRFVPEWSKNSTLVPIKDDDGELRYIDFSHSNAYDLMARPFRTIMNGIQEGEQDGDTLLEGFVNGTMEASGEIMNPFISESIWTEAMADLYVRGGRTEEGRELYTDQTPIGDKMSIQFMHLGKALAPSYKQFQRLGQASFGTPDKTGEILDIGPELAGFMGLRPIKIDPLRTMTFKIAGYQRGIRNARREFTGGFFGLLKGGPVSEEDIIERYITSNKARFKVQQEMFKNINAAETLGESEIDLRKVFTERQVSPKNFNKLSRGEFEPYYPSVDIRRKFREIANNIDRDDPFASASEDLRELKEGFKDLNFGERFQTFSTGGSAKSQLAFNGLESVMPILTEIRNEMNGLSLEDEFDIKLTDYVAVDEEIITPPLPTTPMPIINQPQPAMPTNRSQNIQGKDPITNLTRTEEALLSPMEKVIASRT